MKWTPTLCGCILLTACALKGHNAGQNSALKADGPAPSGAAAGFVCAQGEKQSFSLVAAPGVAAGEKFEIAVPNGKFEAELPSIGLARLDVCIVDDQHVELKRVAYLPGEFGVMTIYSFKESGAATKHLDQATHSFIAELPPANVKVAGVAEALFGDYSKLLIQLDEAPGNRMVVVAGVKVGATPLVAAAKYVHQGAQILPSTSEALIGRLELGDVLAGARCNPGDIESAGAWEIGTASFKAEHCEFLGGGETTGYRITKLTVTDSNTGLSPEDQQAIVLEGDALAQRFKYKFNHHNACDSFDLKLPHVEYAATGPATAGCGQEVENAPDRNFNDENRATLARVRYGEGGWIDSEVRCGHWLLQCGHTP